MGTDQVNEVDKPLDGGVMRSLKYPTLPSGHMGLESGGPRGPPTRSAACPHCGMAVQSERVRLIPSPPHASDMKPGASFNARRVHTLKLMAWAGPNAAGCPVPRVRDRPHARLPAVRG
jgi:hypothetical protein